MLNNLLAMPVGYVSDSSSIGELNDMEIEMEGVVDSMPKEALRGKFRLMEGQIYQVVNDAPPASGLLNVSDEMRLEDENQPGS